MVTRTATQTLMLLGLIFILGVSGCTGTDSPVLPDMQASTDSGADETRDVADEGIYEGVLTDSDGDPLAWAELWLDGELAGWTKKDGSFEIYGLTSTDEVSLEARIEDHVVYTTVLTPALRSAQTIGDPDPDIERGIVWGHVHDQVGPVPNALVVVFNQTQNFGADFANDDGYFYIPDAPAGPCVIVGFAPDHGTGHEPVFVIADGEVQKNLFLPLKMDYGIVGGRVVTGGPWPDFHPIPNAKVSIKPVNQDVEPIHTFTNKWGVYVFPNIPLGPHKLLAQAPCFNDGIRFTDVHPGRNFVGFHLEYTDCGGIEGIVTAASGPPLPNTLVRVSRPGPDGEIKIREQFSDPLGRYRFNFLPPGEYLLEAFRPGFEPFEQAGVPVYPDQWTVVDIVMVPEDPDDGG